MQSPNSRPGRLGRPPRLSRDAILAAAQRVLDEEGVEHLSMRRLARELSSTPMALYRHVLDKDELLMLLLDAYVRRIPRPEFPEHPRERVVAGAQTLHDILDDCPWGVEVLASDKFVSTSATWIVESIVDALVLCGLSPADAVYAYRVIWFYLVGELTARPFRERATTSTDDRRRGLEAVIDGLLSQNTR
ncbi:TetR/AcrR family transcriptional regulator [Streptomyces sp. NPDC057271]|uniref:TetR/AcrR family transcriptional regulator n=1 Tax=unclassified Streptomyces TaxID=2593676 RepID=UPI00363146F3